jgi:hypothetical protein
MHISQLRRIWALLGIVLMIASCSSPPPTLSPTVASIAPTNPRPSPTGVPLATIRPSPLASTAVPAAPTQEAPTVRVTTPTAAPPDLPGTLLFVRRAHGDWHNDRGFVLQHGQIQPLPLPDTVAVDNASPNGNYVVAIRDTKRARDHATLIFNRQTGIMTEVPLICELLICPLQVSPDGNLAAVNYLCELESGSILITPLPHVQAQLTIAMQRPECMSENRQLESWLPGGDAVLVTTGDELQEQDLSGQIKVLATGRWDRPRPTSDGLHILAILQDLQLRSSSLWRIDRATRQRQEIILAGYEVAEAVESPDGRYIVFSQNEVLDTGDCLYLLDLQQPTAQPVCLVQGYRILAWAP